MTKNPTAIRLVAAAGAMERALTRYERKQPDYGWETVTQAGSDLANAIDDYAATLADRIEAGRLYRLTDAYSEKARAAENCGAGRQTKAGHADGTRTAEGNVKIAFGAKTTTVAAYCDAALDMIVAARTIADRIQHGGN